MKLSHKLTIGVLVILSIFFWGLGYVIVSDLRTHMTNNIMAQGEQLASFLVKTSVAPIKNYRFYFLREYALKLEEFDQVAYCEIYNANGESLVELESTYPEVSNRKVVADDADILIVKKSISEDEEYYGSVEIGLYLADVKAGIRDKTLRLIVLFSIILVLVAFSLRWFLDRLLIAPVQELSDSAKKLSKGNFSPSPNTNRTDEIGYLIRSFNLMRVHLKSNFEELECKTRDIQVKNDELVLVDNEVKTLNRKLEEKVKERTMELQKSLEELKETQKQLVEVQKMASLAKLISGLAHEINTPVGVCITAISHVIENVKEIEKRFTQGVLSKKEMKQHLITQTDSNKIIQENLNKASELINLFKLVAVEKSSAVASEFRARDVINFVIGKNRAHSAGIIFNITCDDKLMLKSYMEDFTKVLDSIVLNSLQHGFEKGDEGIISIKATATSSIFRLIYSDSGKGTDSETLKNIYEPFYTTKRGGSTGLGMHIVFNLVTQKLRGTIYCDSTPGSGFQLEIAMPCFIS